MAILKSFATGDIIYLKPIHIFGRDPASADTLLKSVGSSRLHCVIRWLDGRWFLTDESRNGCFLNGERIPSGSRIYLAKGDTFSTSGDDDARWRLETDTAPKPVIVADNNVDYIELDGINILPNEDNPECHILIQGEQWLLEKGHDIQELTEKSCLELDGKTWWFYPNNMSQETTYVSFRFDTPELVFHVSPDNEDVRITLNIGSQSINLGHKSHHYLLLMMARYKLTDTTEAELEHGWMNNDILLHEMGIDINHLNIQIHRARIAIKEFSSYWGQHLLERRRGKVRLSTCKIVIHE